jgi:DhnA family fructose-bisphosphate aldolase class Ia
MAEVTAALDTFSDVAICGSEGSRILVASVPVAASAASTAISAAVEEASEREAADIDDTASSVMSAPVYGMIYII